MPPKNSPAATTPDSEVSASETANSAADGHGEQSDAGGEGRRPLAEPRKISRTGRGSRVRPSRAQRPSGAAAATPTEQTAPPKTATPEPTPRADPPAPRPAAAAPSRARQAEPPAPREPDAADKTPDHAPAHRDDEARARPETRAERVEVPVPSVVRARERGRVAEQNPIILRTEMLTKTFGTVVAANEVSIDVHEGSFTGIVGPNGAGKTTTLSMISGLLRPSSGRVTVRDVNVWTDGPQAKRLIGTLPDRLRLFDRLTGAQLLYYSGVLHGVPESLVAKRVSELAEAFSLESALGRLVSDYSAGMQKKIALACSMIHAPEILVLDEPFEAIDPVSASNVTEILEKFVAGGGSVIMSSHSLDLIQRVCDHVAVIIDGRVIAQGTVDAVRDGISLEERFKHLTGTGEAGKGLEWLHGSSDSD